MAFRVLLQGTPSAYRDAVLLNAAAALVVAGKAADLREGGARAGRIDRQRRCQGQGRGAGPDHLSRMTDLPPGLGTWSSLPFFNDRWPGIAAAIAADGRVILPPAHQRFAALGTDPA